MLYITPNNDDIPANTGGKIRKFSMEVTHPALTGTNSVSYNIYHGFGMPTSHHVVLRDFSSYYELRFDFKHKAESAHHYGFVENLTNSYFAETVTNLRSQVRIYRVAASASTLLLTAFAIEETEDWK